MPTPMKAPSYIPEPPESPPEPCDEAYERNVRNELRDDIDMAIFELDDLEASLRWLDRHIPGDSHFIGWRGGGDKLFDAFRALAIIKKDLEEMKED